MTHETTSNGNAASALEFNHLAGSVATNHHEAGSDLSVRFERKQTCASAARNALLALEERLDADVLDDIRLLVSELVTNAIRHADAPPGGQVAVDVSIKGDSVRVEVADPGEGFEPEPRDEAMTKPGGWGLYLVDRIADRWGIIRNRMTRVWFEIDRGGVAAS
jgi:anti-sigma regulatory factor (Ser/Thr protein kinase)